MVGNEPNLEGKAIVVEVNREDRDFEQFEPLSPSAASSISPKNGDLVFVAVASILPSHLQLVL